MGLDRQPDLLKRRRTKIVATLGPATADPAMIRRLIASGVDVFRLNLAHGDHAGHRELFGRIRAAAEEVGAPVAVLADLAGPKIRVGSFAGGAIQLVEGSTVKVRAGDASDRPSSSTTRHSATSSSPGTGCFSTTAPCSSWSSR